MQLMSGEVDERLPRPCAPSWCASRRTRRRPRKLFGRLGPPDAGAVLAQHGDLEYLAGDGASDGMSNSSASGLGERRRAVLPGEVSGDPFACETSWRYVGRTPLKSECLYFKKKVECLSGSSCWADKSGNLRKGAHDL